MKQEEDIAHTRTTAESIYIHIPFCKTKCPYCDFASWAKKENLIEKYFEALIHEIRTKCEAYSAVIARNEVTKQSSFHPCKDDSEIASAPPRNDVKKSALSTIKTIFIGGGTPSLIAPEYYEKVFNELRTYFKISSDAEITLELNPGTACEDYLKGYKKLGVNRISIGAQSFNEKILEKLGRKHSVNDTIEAIHKVTTVGFTNFNIDLIYAVPGMTKEIWIESIYKALEFKPKHISAYSLTIEPGTPFEHVYKNSKLLPSDDFSFELYDCLCKILYDSGFVHYEVSNFAKRGFESKHNLTYWQAKDFFAFGVSAHRYLNGLRTSNTKNLEAYIVCPNFENIIDFPVNNNFEKIMLSSRLKQGFDIHLIEKVTTKTKDKIISLLYDLSSEGFIELSRNKVHLTDRGLFVNNEIILKLL